LVCREECVPGKTELKLALPVAAKAAANGRARKAFASAQAARPIASAWSGRAQLTGDRVEVSLHGTELPPNDGLDAFVVQNQVVGYAPPKITQNEDGLEIVFPKSEYLTAAPTTLDLVLTERTSSKPYARSVTVPFTAAAVTSTTDEKRSQP